MSTQTIDFSSIGGKPVPGGIDFSSIGGKPVPTAKLADQGTLSKVWDWANKGLISAKSLVNVVGDMMPRDPDMKPGETTADWLDRVQNHIDPDHPYMNALKVGLAGVDKDVARTISSFSSPLSIALMGGGAATKLPGAVGTIAKIAMTGAGAGMAGKGVEDVSEAGTSNTPEAWQQRLQGGAEVAGGGAMAIPGVSDIGPGIVRGTAKGVNVALAKAPGTVGAVTGGAVGAATGIPYGSEIGAGLGAVVGREILPKIQIPGENFGLPKPVYPGAPLPEAPPVYPGANLPDHPGTFPGAPLPEAPNPALLQGNALMKPGAAPPPDPSAALASIPVRMSDLPASAMHQALSELGAHAPLDNVMSRAEQIAKLGDLLNEGLGGKGLEPNVPLKNQGGVITPKPAEGIPEGHTPVDSSALKSYKYDPATREFESVTQNGQHYIHGDVAPEEAAKFEAADSKGKAWADIRKNGTLVAKVVNGKRIPVKPVISPEDSIPDDEWEAGHELGTEVEGSKKR